MNHQTGALAPISDTSTFVNANGAVDIVSDPRGRFIYVGHTAVFTKQRVRFQDQQCEIRRRAH